MLKEEKLRLAEYLNGCLKEFEKDEDQEYINGFIWAVECVSTFFSKESIDFNLEAFGNIALK